MDAQFGYRAVDQHHGSQHHGHRSAHAQNSVRGDLHLEAKQRECQQHQRRAQPVDRQHRHGGYPEQHHDGPDHARRNQSRRGEFHVDPERPDDQQDQRDVGIGNGGDDFLAQRFFILLDDRARRVQCLAAAIEARDHAAIEGGKKRPIVGRHQVGQMLVKRLALRERLALAHRGFGENAISTALGADAAQVCGSVVLQFLLHYGIHLGSHHNGMRRARVGSRRHGGDVTRFQQKKSGRRRAPAARGHVSDHGNWGSDDFLDSLAHGIHQSARSIQPYENQRSVFLFGLGDRAADNLGRDGVYHAIHVDRDYFRGRRNGLRPKRQRYGEKAASDIANYHGSSQSNTIYTTQTTWSETMHNGSETYCS